LHLKEASILVVDDEPMLREIIADWFAGVAGSVLSAENGAQALEMLATNKIDLIITDIRMPVLDGIGLLKKVKAGGIHTPSVIFISGFTDIEPREAFELGAEALLGKPVEYDDLIDTAKRILAGRSVTRP
jgi:YesN/AraC family two-component response regulator